MVLPHALTPRKVAEYSLFPTVPNTIAFALSPFKVPALANQPRRQPREVVSGIETPCRSTVIRRRLSSEFPCQLRERTSGNLRGGCWHTQAKPLRRCRRFRLSDERPLISLVMMSQTIVRPPVHALRLLGKRYCYVRTASQGLPPTWCRSFVKPDAPARHHCAWCFSRSACQ
jgi:hypothetical protein